MTKTCLGLITCTLLSSLASAQPAPLVLGVDYDRPPAFRAARGQVVTIFVSGEPTGLPTGVDKLTAETSPLPTELGGISVVVRLASPMICGDSPDGELCGLIPSTIERFPAPILSVERLHLCVNPDEGAADCASTAVTVQIPNDERLSAFPSGLESEPFRPITDLTEFIVVKDGVEGRPFRLVLLAGGIHILNTCDSDRSMRREKFCAPIASHADGAVITAENPARFGETIVLWAYGLGSTDPHVPSGEISPSPAPVLGFPGSASVPTSLDVFFDNRLNAAPVHPTDSLIANLEPHQIRFQGTSWAGLTSGFVGLYQINVPIPTDLSQVFGFCNGEGIQSNLTINVASGEEFDGARICVDPLSHPSAQ